MRVPEQDQEKAMKKAILACATAATAIGSAMSACSSRPCPWNNRIRLTKEATPDRRRSRSRTPNRTTRSTANSGGVPAVDGPSHGAIVKCASDPALSLSDIQSSFKP